MIKLLVELAVAAEYSIAARKTPGGTVNYQWQLNGNDLSDGTTTTTVTIKCLETSTGQITFVPVDPSTTGLAPQCISVDQQEIYN